MTSFSEKLSVPENGSRVSFNGKNWDVPNNPIIPFIEGDGIGPDIWAATQKVLDAGIEKIYGGEKKIHWMEIYAGEKAQDVYGEWLPQETFDAIKHFGIAIKGPLTTPVGGGFRSLNVTLRQVLDLYACIRPVKWLKGTPSPVKHPEKVNMVIFRENTEDVYSGIEYQSGSADAKRVIDLLKEMGANIREDSGIGIKPISPFGTKRLVAMAIQWAVDNKLPNVSIVHKGNIMKFTEGSFRTWGYEVAAEKFGNETISIDEVWDKYDGNEPADKIVVKDVIADNMFQQVLLNPEQYSVLALPNLNGDYMSDALAAQVGGLGMAPGANVGDGIGLFEATHGTAPKYAGLDKVNPGSLLLSATLMLRSMGWIEAADKIEAAIEQAISDKVVTYDLARQMEGATEVKCSEFGEAIIERL